MKEPQVSKLASGFRSSNKLNENIDEIKASFRNTISRDGSGPNEMLAPLDMNSQRIINLPAPLNETDPVRLMDILNVPLLTLGPTVQAAKFGVKANGFTDDTAALLLALAFVPSGTIELPAGTMVVSGTLRMRHNQFFKGQGSNLTYFKRTGDYGDTIICGFSEAERYPENALDYGMRGGGISGVTLYHDHGTGANINVTEASFVNPVFQQSAHLRLYTLTGCGFSDIRIYNLPYGVYQHGGYLNTFDRFLVLGVNDPLSTTPGMKELKANWVLDTDNQLHLHPKDNTYTNVYMSGGVAVGRSLTFPGDHTTTSVVASLGAEIATLWIKASEANVWSNNCYFAYGQKYSVLYEAQAGVALLDDNFVGNFFDGVGTGSQLGFKSNNANYAQKLTFVGNQFTGQIGTYNAVLIEAPTGTGTKTAASITFSGNEFCDFVGSVFNILGGHGITITGNKGSEWNVFDYYVANPYGSSFAYVSAASRLVTVVGNTIGGRDDFSGPANCAYKVYAEDWIGSVVLSEANNGLTLHAGQGSGAFAKAFMPTNPTGIGAAVTVQSSGANEFLILSGKGLSGVLVQGPGGTFDMNNSNAWIDFGKPLKPPVYTVATLPAAGILDGSVAYCSNARVMNVGGTIEGAGAGTGGLVTCRGGLWKLAGTNITAVA